MGGVRDRAGSDPARAGSDPDMARTSGLMAMVLVMVWVTGGAGALAHHPPVPPSPWIDWRPVSHALPGKDRRVRPHLHWPSPCYLDLEPVVFPGPPPPVRPLFLGSVRPAGLDAAGAQERSRPSTAP